MPCKPDGSDRPIISVDASASLPVSDQTNCTIHEMNDNDFNSELPDELSLLAEQLTSDAGMLSELYPARAPQFLPSIIAQEQAVAEQTCEPQDVFLRPMPVWMRWSAAAAVLLCAVWSVMGYVDDQP